jgi:hypothetical protein
MESQIAPLAAILDLNTDLLLNTLEGLGDDEARVRLPGGGNSLVFLAAHLTDTRHFLAELRDAWCSVSTHVRAALASLDAGDLARPNADHLPSPAALTSA